LPSVRKYTCCCSYPTAAQCGGGICIFIGYCMKREQAGHMTTAALREHASSPRESACHLLTTRPRIEIPLLVTKKQVQTANFTVCRNLGGTSDTARRLPIQTRQGKRSRECSTTRIIRTQWIVLVAKGANPVPTSKRLGVPRRRH